MRAIAKNAYTDFCIECGAPAKVESYCTACFVKRQRLFDVKDFRLTSCSCGRVLDGEWKKASMEDIIRKRIKSPYKIEKITFTQRKVGNRIYVHLSAEGKIKNLHISQEKDFSITTRTNNCDICAKQSGNYYEASLQLRGRSAEKILGKIESISRKEDITTVVKLKAGYDVRFISKSKAAEIARWLGERYKVKSSYKLVTEKKGRSFIGTSIQSGDIMEEQQPLRVRTPRGKETLGIIEALLGVNRLKVRCQDNKIRICRIPGKLRKRRWMKQGNIIIVKPWDIQGDERGDAIWVYSSTEVSWLRRKGVLTMQL